MALGIDEELEPSLGALRVVQPVPAEGVTLHPPGCDPPAGFRAAQQPQNSLCPALPAGYAAPPVPSTSPAVSSLPPQRTAVRRGSRGTVGDTEPEGFPAGLRFSNARGGGSRGPTTAARGGGDAPRANGAVPRPDGGGAAGAPRKPTPCAARLYPEPGPAAGTFTGQRRGVRIVGSEGQNLL